MTAGGLKSDAWWRWLLVAATGLTLLIYLYHAFLVPGTLTYAPLTIQDDARQFLVWMSRLGNPGAMPGDLVADYWQSVSPPFYRLIYAGAAAIGLEPNLLARLMPVALMMVSTWLTWRIARRMSPRPLVAFVAAAFLMIYLIHDDSLYSSTPRAFSAPLFLLFIDGLQRDRGKVMVAALLLLGLLYPTTAIVGLTMLGLSRIGVRPWRIDFGARSWILGGSAAAAILLAVVPFENETGRWEPTLTLAEALQQPNLSEPGGRSSIVGFGGTVDYLCSARMGVVPEVIPCWSTPYAVLPNLLIMVPMVVLAIAALRRRLYKPGEAPGDLIHVWVILAGTLWWAVAMVVAFKLHLPSRYPQRTISLLEFLAFGQVAGMALDRWITQRRYVAAGLCGLVVTALLAVSFVTPLPGFVRPSDPAAIARIAAMPADTMIGGVTDELAAVPALTGRPVLATIEHSIPYHRGYYLPLEARLQASLAAVSSPDPAVLADYVRRYRIGVIAIDRALLTGPRLPPSYASVVPAAARAAAAALAAGPSALQRRAPGCIIHDGPLVLLDASCLATGNRAPI